MLYLQDRSNFIKSALTDRRCQKFNNLRMTVQTETFSAAFWGSKNRRLYNGCLLMLFKNRRFYNGCLLMFANKESATGHLSLFLMYFSCDTKADIRCKFRHALYVITIRPIYRKSATLYIFNHCPI